MKLQKLPDVLASKITLTPDEVAELPITLKDWSPVKITTDPDDAFRAAIKLLEYKGIKKKTWKDLNSGVVMAYLMYANNEIYQPLTVEGKLKPLPKAYEGKDDGLTAGEKFDLYEKHGEMSLDKLPDVDTAYNFLASHRDLADINDDNSPVYGKDLYVAYVTMGGYAVEKKDMLGLSNS